MFISKKLGSFVMIGSLLLSQEILPESEVLEADHCGYCMACLPACPTDAINVKTRTLFASKCISTWTIELFKEAPAPIGMENATGELFGCDLCQDVCPWNKRLERSGDYPRTHTENERTQVLAAFFCERDLQLVANDLKSMSNSAFRKKFVGTPLERTGRLGLLKNVEFWLNQS